MPGRQPTPGLTPFHLAQPVKLAASGVSGEVFRAQNPVQLLGLNRPASVLCGMIDDPACTAGRVISPSPAVGPDEARRP